MNHRTNSFSRHCSQPAALALTACTADNTPVEAEAQAGPTKSGRCAVST
ncbi:hypothetical protein [Streptomyces sp. KL116D]